MNRIRSQKWTAALLGAALALALGVVAPALAATHGPGVQVVAKGSLADTLDQLEKMVAGNGMMVMGELHQGKVLAMTGLDVASETVFVGNPTVGKQLFSAEPGAGLVVPVRINLYVDSSGRTVVSYIPPSQQLAGFHNEKLDAVAKMLDGKLQTMVQMLAR